MKNAEDDVAFRLLHTADWHLGKRFPSFEPAAQTKLQRARLLVLDEVFAAATRERVDAVLCAGDLFDDPAPGGDWWRGLLDALRRLPPGFPPVFLLPGNHDPIVTGSVWLEPEFRRDLPPFVRVIDREDFSAEIRPGLVLFAVPCTSKSGARDPVEKIPPRAPGDLSIRVGLVHGSTFDCADVETNFPIRRGGAKRAGLDYLAIGDTHGYRIVESDPPVVYPGAPEPTAFDEIEPGHVVTVLLSRSFGARPRAVLVGQWRWHRETITDLQALRDLAREDLRRTVLRLDFDLEVTLAEQEEADRLLTRLAGDEARDGAAGVFDADVTGLRLSTSGDPAGSAFPPDMPRVLQDAIASLTAVAADPDPDRARRAKLALFKLSTLTKSGSR